MSRLTCRICDSYSSNKCGRFARTSRRAGIVARPYREALFLRLRLDWLGGFAGTMIRTSASAGLGVFDRGLLEELTLWTEEETAAQLGESGLTLGRAWERFWPLLQETPGQPLRAEVITGELSISRNTWDAWISRGWKHLQRGLGEERFAHVFSFWQSRRESAPMKTDVKADVSSLCNRELELFKNAHNAWDHMLKHVLGRGGNDEEQGWRLLVTELNGELSAGCLKELRELARSGTVESPPSRLRSVYDRYLALVKKAVEQAVEREWYWEEKPGAEGRWKAFAANGILSFLDDDYVLTGFLPGVRMNEKDTPFASTRYDLFQACLERVQWKHNRAVDSGRVERTSPALLDLLSHGLDEMNWSRIA